MPDKDGHYTQEEWANLFATFAVKIARSKVNILDHPEFEPTLMAFFEKEFSTENFLFLKAVHDAIMFKNLENEIKTIIDEYILLGAKNEINVDPQKLNAIRENILDEKQQPKQFSEQEAQRLLQPLVVEVVTLMQTNSLMRVHDVKHVETMKELKRLNILDVTENIPKELIDDFKKLIDSPTRPKLEDFFDFKIKLMKAANSQNAEFIQRAIGILDDKWLPAEEKDFLKSEKESLIEKLKKTPFPATCASIFDAFKKQYESLLLSPKQEKENDLLDLQRNIMFAIKLTSSIAALYSKTLSKIKPEDERELQKLMVEFDVLIKDGAPAHIVFNVMSIHLQTTIDLLKDNSLKPKLSDVLTFCQTTHEALKLEGKPIARPPSPDMKFE